MHKFLLSSILMPTLVLAFCMCCTAQNKAPFLIFGVETGGSFSVIPERSTGIYDRYFFLRTAPYINVQLRKNLYAGLNYEIETGQINGTKITPLTGFGVNFRYLLPINFKDKWIANRLQLYSETSWLLLDHAIDRSMPLGVKYLSKYANLNIQFAAGFNFRIFNSVYVSYAIRPMFYTEGKPFQLSKKLALEYHFGEIREKYIKPVREESPNEYRRNRAFDVSFFLKKVTFGSSVTYLIDKQDVNNALTWESWTWNINAAVSLTSDIDVGIAALPIWAKERNGVVQRNFLTGFFTQYDFLRQKNGERLFIETGFYKGNICTCGESNPYYKPGLTYIPFGGGWEKRLNHGPVSLDISFLIYKIATKLPIDKWAYNQYVVGLNYNFTQ